VRRRRTAATRASYKEGVGFGVASFLVMTVLGIGSSIAVARVYGIATVGAFALAVAPSMAMNLLSSVREQAALVRELAVLPPRAPRITGLFAATLAFSSALTLVVGGVIAAIGSLVLSRVIGRPDLVAPALVLIANSALPANIAWNADMVFAAFRAGRALLWIRLYQLVVFVGVAIAAGLAWGGVWGLVLATCAGTLTSLVHRCIGVRDLMRMRVSSDEIRRGFDTLPALIRFGLRLMPGVVADGASTETGVWVLGIVSPISAVGAYARGMMVTVRLLDLNYRIREMLFPTLVERRSRGDRAGFDGALVDSMRYVALVMFIPAAAGAGAAHGVMGLFGAGFSAGADAFALLMLVPPLAVIAGIQTDVLTAVDRPLLTSGISVGRLAAVIGLSIPLAMWLGPTGAALGLAAAYAVSVVVGSLLTFPYLSNPLRSLWPARQLLAVALGYAAGFGCARALDSALPGVGGCAAGLVGGCLADAAVILALGGLTSVDRQRIAAVRSKVSARRSAAATAVTGVR
jgi:O-antigen/teichoic acid export membrane protein